MVPLLPSYIAEEVQHHGLPEVRQFSEVEHVNESDEHVHEHSQVAGPVFELEDEVGDHEYDENEDAIDEQVNTFSEQDFMNYVIKLVI